MTCLLVPSVSPSPSNGNTPSQPKWNSGKPLRPPPPVPKPVNGMYPGLSPGDSSPHEYERLINLAPIRPAPRPPGVAVSSYATLATYNGLEGVPFVLGSGFQNLSDTKPLPVIKAKTKYDLDKEGVSEKACKNKTGHKGCSTEHFEIGNVWSAKPAMGDMDLNISNRVTDVRIVFYSRDWRKVITFRRDTQRCDWL
uniref:Uncharacterized protein n=1 Tax=Timema tahoe TaxID=61484 RepID=A0A7R9IKG6_9NEOP|nr:unnamed protein product [Timema tahoe]